MRWTVRETCTITLERNEETEVETMATCIDDPSKDDIQVLEDKLLTARTNKNLTDKITTTPKFKIHQEETMEPHVWNIDRLYLGRREGENQQKVQWQEKLHWLTLKRISRKCPYRLLETELKPFLSI